MPADPLPPPRPELIALLDAVKDHPDEDTPRLVLADWLDEQDNPLDAERAKFIRAQIAKPRANHVGTGAKRTAFLKRWLGPVTEFAGTLGKRIEFFRGLPTIKVHGLRFAKRDVPGILATAFEAFAFVQLVIVTGPGGARMADKAARPEMRYVPWLSLDPEINPFRAWRRPWRHSVSPNLAGIAGSSAPATRRSASRARKAARGQPGSRTIAEVVDRLQQVGRWRRGRAGELAPSREPAMPLSGEQQHRRRGRGSTRRRAALRRPPRTRSAQQPAPHREWESPAAGPVRRPAPGVIPNPVDSFPSVAGLCEEAGAMRVVKHRPHRGHATEINQPDCV